MLKLKSIVKTREQLLATGWVANRSGSFSNTEIHRGHLHVEPEMLGRPYNGVVKDFTHKCTLEGVGGIWTLCPEMMLVVDQWGFVRHPNTLRILMWDVPMFGGAIFIDKIDKSDKDYPIRVSERNGDPDSYTRIGGYYKVITPTLSKYPYSLQYGGYTPFDFDELVEAFNCPRVVEGNDDSSNDDSSTTNDATPEIVTSYEADGYKYTVSRVKI